MMARLGFSVAIHTQPDILLVDEVLAVGDLNFVIKCFRKIFEFQRNGGAMLLVSHNIYNIRANCSRALWIEKGKMQMFGPANDVCDAYEAHVAQQNADSVEGQVYKDDRVSVTDISYPATFTSGEDLLVEFSVETKTRIEKPILMAAIFTLTGVNVVCSIEELKSFSPGKHRLKLRVPNLKVSVGTYSLNLVVSDSVINNQLYASTNQNKFIVTGDVSPYGAGLMNVDSSWEQIQL
jgi:ABC-type glutathione transport system ATPase component